ncbi:response regulator transcription factor [Deltaproteobacteria bacterium TL4]
MNKSEKKRVLVIEDEQHIADGLQLNLSLQGYEVLVAEDGLSGLQKWKEFSPDLIVLDLMLPAMDGLAVLQNIRLKNERIPILILSAKGTSDDKVKGFTYGVDDYLSKPFNLDEFLLRVERLLNRSSWNSADETENQTKLASKIKTYNFGTNKIDFELSTAYCQSGIIILTEQEIKLLKLFIVNRGIPLSREKLLEIGWGYSHNTSTRTVDNFIVRLRKYFEVKPQDPVYFKSLRAVGYLFDHDTD